MKNALLFFVFACICFCASAQTDSTKLPPFQRFPSLPPVQILLSDSSTIYTKEQIPKDKPVLFMVFSPDCSHCQDETTDMVAHMDELKDVHIVMITMRPLSMMKDFIDKYDLAKYSNIIIGKDIYYFTPGFFDLRNIPFIAIYNKKGKLVEGHGGTVPFETVIEILQDNN
jgi:thiol-disulfide isomerase/thioredoxin